MNLVKKPLLCVGRKRRVSELHSGCRIIHQAERLGIKSRGQITDLENPLGPAFICNALGVDVSLRPDRADQCACNNMIQDISLVDIIEIED